MKTSVHVRLPVEQTWQLIADLPAQQRWLGSGTHLQPVINSRIQLNHEAGPWRSGTVMKVQVGERIECLLEPRSSWIDARESTRLTISIESHPAGGTQVTVEETELVSDKDHPSPHDDAFAFWKAALKRLQGLASQINRRRNNPRQALIIIHGIGEQQPGVTLKSFVDGLISVSKAEIESWSKPDRTSRIFELRRITVKASDRQVRPTTDVFELYWAHVIRDTKLSQVASWLRHLLLRKGVPKRFVPVWVFGWIVIASVLVFSIAEAAGYGTEWTNVVLPGSIAVLIATTCWRLLGRSFVIDSMGDAARYLTPRPENIEHRQAIREAGVDLLDKLHSEGRYDRIVIVGHSLGSVIAYDIISHYWIRVHRKHLRLPKVSNKGATTVERGLEESDVAIAQEKQHGAWKVARSNSQPWLISDLVTLGSPLSAAKFLMARTSGDFQRAKADRELPTCPPVHEVKGKFRRVSFDRAYTDRFGGKHKQFSFFHHAAPFAVTRWTNLHFKSSLLKDPIGGPVAPQFGLWVNDVELKAPKKRPFFLHTCYWREKGNEANLRILTDALRLDSGPELLAEFKEHSPLMYLPRLTR